VIIFKEAANVEDTLKCFAIRIPLILTGTGESQSPMSSCCSGKVDESSIYISPYELNANSISDIKTFNPSYQLSFFYYHGPFNPSPLWIK
jgi:hypothetical protein